jgi:hypothetical protein
MAPEAISVAYFTNPSLSLCVCMCAPPIVARQRLGKHVPVATNTPNGVLLDASFSVRSVSYPMRVCGSVCVSCRCKVKTYPCQWRIFRGVVFCAVLASKESRRLVLPRTPCYLISGDAGSLPEWYPPTEDIQSAWLHLWQTNQVRHSVE